MVTFSEMSECLVPFRKMTAMTFQTETRDSRKAVERYNSSGEITLTRSLVADDTAT